MVPITFCTPWDGCTLGGCQPERCVTDDNPRSCTDLGNEIRRLIDAVTPALAEAGALTDILTTVSDPTIEVISGAGDMAIALFLGMRALEHDLDTLETRHPDEPADLTVRRTITAMDHAREQLVGALLANAARHIA